MQGRSGFHRNHPEQGAKQTARLATRKQACIDVHQGIKANLAAATMSDPFLEQKTKHPLLWKERRATLALDEAQKKGCQA